MKVKGELQRVVDEFYSVCVRRMLGVNAGKNKMMVFERKEVEVVDYSNPCRVCVPVARRCEVHLGGERMEEVKELKCLGTVLCKHGKMDEEISCERHECYRITCKGYERKECVHGGKERFKK